jgi:hypothetical protein
VSENDRAEAKGSDLTGSLKTRKAGLVFLALVLVGGVLATGVAIAIALRS